MKVVHIESGLGNQMLGYLEYLAIKQSNPKEEIYVETIIYEIKEAYSVIYQWNGYELERVFGIKARNIRELFSPVEWEKIVDEVRNSRFWEKNWNYPKYICNALNKYGNFELINLCISNDYHPKRGWLREIIYDFTQNTSVGYNLRRCLINLNKRKFIERTSSEAKLFRQDARDLYCGFTLRFKYLGNGIERIDKELRECFKFPLLNDDNNLFIKNLILSTNSVALHIRRGDMLTATKKYYDGGYFKRSIKYIKNRVPDPVFFVFCDPDSIEWTKCHFSYFGLNKNDKIYFIDWNKEDCSYIDMQLISLCKNAVVTVSSFGWWGSYLISNPNKITCSPEININTTNHF